MGKQIGLIPSYILKGTIGKQIAGLKGMEEGWFYPTFILNFIKNPAPLLLYDKIYYDESATFEALNHILVQGGIHLTHQALHQEIIDSENPHIDKILRSLNKDTSAKVIKDVKILKELLSTTIFEKINVEDQLNQEDVKAITKNYYHDYNNEDYLNVINGMVSKFGVYYARPTPKAFEAMNINVLNVINNKLKSAPMDDSVRAPLYRYKLIEILKNETEAAEKYIDNLPQVILGLPTLQVRNVEEFLEYHQSKGLNSFRRYINEISSSAEELSNDEVKKELYDANKKLLESKYSPLTLVGSVLRLTASSIFVGLSINNPVLAGVSSLNFMSSLLATKKQIDDYWEIQDLKWFSFLKGLTESQM